MIHDEVVLSPPPLEAPKVVLAEGVSLTFDAQRGASQDQTGLSRRCQSHFSYAVSLEDFEVGDRCRSTRENAVYGRRDRNEAESCSNRRCTEMEVCVTQDTL